jgi:teichuronic acid biosynthesis glycosyltransferase TuaC
LHVLTLTPRYPSTRDDTEDLPVSEPLDRLAKAGVRNTLLAVQPIYERKARTSGTAISREWLRYFSLPGKQWRPAAGAFVFARIIGRVRELDRIERIDVVHAHGPLPCGHAGMLVSAELNIPYVVSVYGLQDLSTARASARAEKWSGRIARLVFARSSRAVCASERVREAVLAMMGRSCRTSVVYDGVDSELFSPAAESSETGLTVLSSGNLHEIEGHDVLIRATAALVKEFPGLTLEIIGDGRERSRLQTLVVRLGLDGVVRFLGRQSRIQVAESMKRCALFVLSSRTEQVERVYLEAMSSGKAVIGGRGQGVAEIIRHGINGFLVGPENEEELRLAMGMLLGQPHLRRSLGAAARDTILDRFTLEQQAQNLRRIYREVVA